MRELKMTLLRPLFLTLFFTITNGAFAQKSFLKEAVVQQNANFYVNHSYPVIGQSFIAEKTGMLTAVTIVVGVETLSSKSNTLDFWVGKNPGRGEILFGKPRQKVKLKLDNSNSMVFIPLDKPFPVSKGKKYRLQFGQDKNDANLACVFAGSFTNSYPLGEIYFHDGESWHNRDLTFSVSISTKSRAVVYTE